MIKKIIAFVILAIIIIVAVMAAQDWTTFSSGQGGWISQAFHFFWKML